MKWLVCTVVLAMPLPDQAAPPPSQRLTFAVPETPSRISLGAFDSSGKLIRTLAAALPEDAFSADLNGLGIAWDGLDEAGTPSPPGTYSVRGWAVPETLSLDGEAYFFNDWSGPDGAPPIVRPWAVLPRPDGFSLVAENPAGRLSLWESQGSGPDLRDEFVLPTNMRIAAVGQECLALQENGLSGLVFLERSGDGLWEISAPVPAPADVVAAVAQGAIAVCRRAESEVRRISSAGEHRITFLPCPPTALAIDGDVLWATDGRNLWHTKDGPALPVPIGDTGEIWSIAPGPQGSLWLAGLAGEAVVVRQFDSGGTLLRELKPGRGPLAVFADVQDLRVFLLQDSETAQNLRGLRPSPQTDPSAQIADWELFLDATTDASRAGLESFPEGFSPKESVAITLDPNPLDPGPATIPLAVKPMAGAIWLTDSHGLPLLPICGGMTGTKACFLAGGIGNNLRIAVGRGFFAETFLIRGLSGLAAINAGTITIGP